MRIADRTLPLICMFLACFTARTTLSVDGNAAQACPIEHSVLTAGINGDVTPSIPDLEGSLFTVVRYAASFRPVADPRFVGGAKISGSLVIEIDDAGTRWIIKQSYNPGSAPWVQAGSLTPDDDAATGIDWQSRQTSPYPLPLGSQEPLFSVFDGPLTGYDFYLSGCSR